MCKRKYNPVAYMLSTYKLHFNSNSEYEISFKIHNEKMEYDKLSAFCHSLSALMELNNISYTLKEHEAKNKIDLFYKSTLVITYETNFF